MKPELFREILQKYPNIKFHENPFSVSGRTAETEMRKLKVSFRSCADTPKRRHAVKRTLHTHNIHGSQVHKPQAAKRSSRLTVHYKSILKLMVLRIAADWHSKAKKKSTYAGITYLHSTDRPSLWVPTDRWTQRWTSASNICARSHDTHVLRGHIIVTVQFLWTPACTIPVHKNQAEYETIFKMTSLCRTF